MLVELGFVRAQLRAYGSVFWFRGKCRNLGEAFLVALFPIAATLLGVFEYLLIFGFHFSAVFRNIRQSVRELLVGEIEAVADQSRRPSRDDVIHDAIERNAGTGNRQSATRAHDGWLGCCFSCHRDVPHTEAKISYHEAR